MNRTIFIEGNTYGTDPATATVDGVCLYDRDGRRIETDFGHMDGSQWIGFDIKKVFLPALMNHARREYGKCPHPESVLDLKEAFEKIFPLDVHRCLHWLNPASARGVISTQPAVYQLYYSMMSLSGNSYEAMRQISIDGEPMDAYGYIRKEADEPVLNFGKYRGKKVSEVLEYDRSYIDWCIRFSSMPHDVLEILKIEYDRGTCDDWLAID